jgi:ribosomal protein S20
LAHSSRGWTGARTPSSIKRVRQTARRRAINQPRRTAAKTLIARALDAAADGQQQAEVQQALTRAISALDLAAKSGAIHRNAADRRKSRLVLKVNAALAGEALAGAGKAARTTGKTAAAKEARARIAAGRATKAKGAQTAAGKARAALARTTREAGHEEAAEAPKPAKATASPRASAAKKATASPRSAAKKVTAAKKATAAKKVTAAKSRPARPAATKS